MTVRVLSGDCRQVLPTLAACSVQCCVTSPPYFGLRDYGHAEQIGLEASPEAYVAELVAVFREVRRVLADDGTLWLNLGDSYAGTGPAFTAGVHSAASSIYRAKVGGKESQRRIGECDGLAAKNLIGIPWRVAFALQADGWWLRQDIIWHKPNPMPESVTDRCTKAHEYVFLLSKSARYHFDAEAIAETVADSTVARLAQDVEAQLGSLRVPGKTNGPMRAVGGLTTRNRRSVWTIATQPFSESHFATMAPELARLCILSGCPPGGAVLDPFAGAGTTGLVADRLQRDAVLVEVNPDYVELLHRRILGDAPLFAEVVA